MNGGFIGSNLATYRSLIFVWMFFFLFIWQRIHLVPTTIIIDLHFKIQENLLIFGTNYSGPRCPWLWYSLTNTVVTCLAGKIMLRWHFHSYGIFVHFSLPFSLITLFSSRNGDHSFNDKILASSLLSSWILYSELFKTPSSQLCMLSHELATSILKFGQCSYRWFTSFCLRIIIFFGFCVISNTF